MKTVMKALILGAVLTAGLVSAAAFSASQAVNPQD